MQAFKATSHVPGCGRRFALAWVTAVALAIAGCADGSGAADEMAGSVGQPGSSSCTLEPTSGTEKRLIGARMYNLFVPEGLTGPQVPLLLTFHGGPELAEFHESFTGWTPYAAEHNFIVAYPQGLANFWNSAQGSYDVAYARDVVADISRQYCIDPDRIYLDGHSLGAIMAFRLACDASDLFASMVEYAGVSTTFIIGSPCEPARAVAVGMFQGDADQFMDQSYDEQTRDEWLALDQCVTEPARSQDNFGTLDRYGHCAPGVEVWQRIYAGQGHGWPAGDMGEDMREIMWNFLQDHPLSAAAGSQPGDGPGSVGPCLPAVAPATDGLCLGGQ